MQPRLRPPSSGYEYPGLGAQRAGRAAGGDQSRVFFGAKTIAATLLDRLTEPTLLHSRRKTSSATAPAAGSAARNG
jgi:hypothetical protein